MSLSEEAITKLTMRRTITLDSLKLKLTPEQYAAVLTAAVDAEVDLKEHPRGFIYYALWKLGIVKPCPTCGKEEKP